MQSSLTPHPSDTRPWLSRACCQSLSGMMMPPGLRHRRQLSCPRGGRRRSGAASAAYGERTPTFMQTCTGARRSVQDRLKWSTAPRRGSSPRLWSSTPLHATHGPAPGPRCLRVNTARCTRGNCSGAQPRTGPGEGPRGRLGLFGSRGPLRRRTGRRGVRGNLGGDRDRL